MFQFLAGSEIFEYSAYQYQISQHNTLATLALEASIEQRVWPARVQQCKSAATPNAAGVLIGPWEPFSTLQPQHYMYTYIYIYIYIRRPLVGHQAERESFTNP